MIINILCVILAAAVLFMFVKKTLFSVHMLQQSAYRSGDYLTYRKGYKAGLGMTVGGAACAVVGGVAFLGSFVAALAHGLSASFAGEEVPIWVDAALYTSTVVTLGGTAVFLAGMPTLCVYKNRLNKLEKAYNGLGLTFAF